MGTNFYVRQKATRQQKIEMEDCISKDDWNTLQKLIPEEVHIGKRSAGWKFLWNANNFEYFKPNKESLIEFLKSGQIYDEYGKNFTFDQFWNDELKGFLDKGVDIEEYYKIDEPRYIHYENLHTIDRFKIDFGINVNKYGEFYIDDLRFTTCDCFS